jgi:predicted outer membrane protein
MSKTISTLSAYNSSRITIMVSMLFGAIVLLAIASCQESPNSSSARQIGAAIDDPSLINDKLFVITEYEIGMRERALAEIVFERTTDPDVKALAKTVREGHQSGIDKLVSIASTLKIPLPDKISTADLIKLDIVQKMPAAEIPRFFLIHQKAIHAWDITIFSDYANFAVNEQLKKYILETQQPLRMHAEQVVLIANKKGVEGSLVAASVK